MQHTAHIKLHGRVQGVFFRESLCRKAQELGVTGWVRNRGDGSLEAVIQGEAAAVKSAIEWARHGPEAARVERIEISAGEGEYADFRRLPTL